MSLRKQQSEFAEAIGKLIKYIYSFGYEVTFGDFQARNVNSLIDYLESTRPYLPDNMLLHLDNYINTLKKMRHSKHSRHYERLAADLNLFKDGWYLTTTEDHKIFGEYWESIGGTWGGRWNDGNHYSWGEK